MVYRFSIKFNGALSIQITSQTKIKNNPIKISIPEIKYSGYTSKSGELFISSISASNYTLIIDDEILCKHIVSNMVVTAGKITYISIKIN